MNKYTTLKEKHAKDITEFPMFFAFSDEQFERGLKDLKVKEDEIIGIGMGGIIRKRDKQKYLDLIKRHYEEEKEAREDDEYVYQMFRYELANHEYSYTYDWTDTFDSLGLEFDKLDERMKKLLFKATKEIKDTFEVE
jgi:hypothetical protein